MKVAPALSLDQMQVLVAVVDTGGFAAAARELGRATSAISYAIDSLESQLGVELFHREARRRKVLSSHGEAVVNEARSILKAADMLRARVGALSEGLEAEVTLAVDQIVPQEKLVETLHAFHREFPAVRLSIRAEALGGVERLVRSGEAGIGICGSLHMSSEGFTVRQIASARIIPVVSSNHPLLSSDSDATPRDHLQIVVSDLVNDEKQPACVVISRSNWRVGDLASARSLLLGGIGWAIMPESLVRADIAAGQLCRLDLRDFREGHYPLQIVHKVNSPPGPAGCWLIERIAADLTPEHLRGDAAMAARSRRGRRTTEKNETTGIWSAWKWPLSFPW